MPELPEVETIARQLNAKLRGQSISRITVLNEKSFSGNIRSLVDKSVVSVSRRAKTLILTLDNGQLLISHLKMTGQMIYVDTNSRVAGGHPSEDFYADLPNQHTRVIIEFRNGGKLFFNDLRKFGWIKSVDAEGLAKYFSIYGPDSIPTINLEYLLSRAARMPKSSIKKFILDQHVISGVGNIYADEVLFDIRVHPSTLVSKVTKEQWEALAFAIPKKLEFAIEKGGTTDNDYVDAYGKKGGMQDYLNVYHKQGKLCTRNCGAKIEKIRVAGRGTHFCPICQKGAV